MKPCGFANRFQFGMCRTFSNVLPLCILMVPWHSRIKSVQVILLQKLISFSLEIALNFIKAHHDLTLVLRFHSLLCLSTHFMFEPHQTDHRTFASPWLCIHSPLPWRDPLSRSQSYSYLLDIRTFLCEATPDHSVATTSCFFSIPIALRL